MLDQVECQFEADPSLNYISFGSKPAAGAAIYPCDTLAQGEARSSMHAEEEFLSSALQLGEENASLSGAVQTHATQQGSDRTAQRLSVDSMCSSTSFSALSGAYSQAGYASPIAATLPLHLQVCSCSCSRPCLCSCSVPVPALVSVVALPRFIFVILLKKEIHCKSESALGSD